jgi:hypothetical protein
MRDSLAKLDNLVKLATWKRRKLAALPIQKGDYVFINSQRLSKGYRRNSINQGGPFRVTQVIDCDETAQGRESYRMVYVHMRGLWQEDQVRRAAQKGVRDVARRLTRWSGS